MAEQKVTQKTKEGDPQATSMYNILGPISSTPGQSSGSVKEKKPVSRETRQLQVENKYLKLILEDLHKSIIVGEAKLQMKLKPPEDIENDKLLIELTDNTRSIYLKFNELETELDYLHRIISHLTSMIAAGDRSKEPIQEKTNIFTATGRQPKRNPTNKFEQREQFPNIDKDIELLASTWRELSASKEEMANKIKENQHNYEKLWAEHQNLKTSFAALQKRCNEDNALSTIASDRFTHDNVNIADLSDADRPTKLQEVYSELYDNEWTDAFQELITHENITEDDAIMILLKILISSFHNCREITWGRYERLKNFASSVYIEEEISMPSPKTSDTDNNLDTMQDGTESRESGENKGMHVVNEKALKVIDVKVTVDSGHSSSIGKSKETSETEDVKNGAKENMATGDTNVREASTDKSENAKEKNGANDNEESDDRSVSEAPTDKFENRKGKNGGNENEASDDRSNGANENEESDDRRVSEVPTDTFENKNRKKGANKNEESDDQSVCEPPTDKFESKNGKNGAKENCDINVSEAPKDKSENKKGKHLLCTIDLNFDLMHDIKGIWRKTTIELKGIAAEPLYSVIETCLDMPFIGQPMTSKYLKSCIDLCWKMGVQQRPMHLDGFAEMNAYDGKKFDKDKFRAYTQSGSHVAFFVWPTLYLYEGGPILVKGIVQCCSPVEAKNEEPS